MDNAVLGIAYAGSKEEYELDNGVTLLEQKVNNAKNNELKVIQVRTNDVMDYYKIYGGEKLINYIRQLFDGGMELSVHLPSPVPDRNNPLEFNDFLAGVSQGVKMLSMAGVSKFTIHPHYNRLNYAKLSIEDKEKMVNNMGMMFAQLVAMAGGNIVLAIENVPVRSIEDVEIKPTDEPKIIEKKKKAIKNISYGMYPEEMRKIIDITRNKLKTINPMIDADYLVGMTFDTGHATNKTPEENKLGEIARWVSMFEKDIRIFHIAPRGEHNLEKTGELMHNIYNAVKGRNMKAVAFVENHYSFGVNNKIASFCKAIDNNAQVKKKPENKDYAGERKKLENLKSYYSNMKKSQIMSQKKGISSDGGIEKKEDKTLTLKRTKTESGKSGDKSNGKSSGNVNIVVLSLIICLVEIITFSIVYMVIK